MLSKEENDLLTRIEPGTKGGDFFRSFWQPVALSEELPIGGAPLHVRILGEDLVLFRDENGSIGLMDLYCPHRGADLSYGRIEDGGLRCLFHGWLLDKDGKCLQQPGEPADSTFHQKVRHHAYRCKEVNDLIFAYMGKGETPEFPNYEFLNVPYEQAAAVKVYQECNYLQALEGNFDQVHLSFLHRIFTPEEKAISSSGNDNIVTGSSYSAGELLARDTAPTIDTEETGFGMREYVVRKTGDGGYFLKIENFVYPAVCAVPGGVLGKDGYLINWYVPIDDYHHWKYQITFSRSTPIDKRNYKLDVKQELMDGYRMKRNKRNRYMQDRESMKNDTYTGLGKTFAVHDAWAAEAMRPINDRSKEHLGYEDKSVILLRKILLKIFDQVSEQGVPPQWQKKIQQSMSDLIVLSEVLPNEIDWKQYLQEKLLELNQSKRV